MKRIALATLVLPVALSGCGSLLNTADNDSFSCPGMPQGIICKTPLAVYKSTNRPLALTDSDMPIGQKVQGVQFGDDQGNVARPEAPALTREPAAGRTRTTTVADARPIRTPAQVMRIWIAPWIDSKDDLHYPSYLYTEIQPRRWSFGKNGYAGKGMVVPHRELAAVAPVTPVKAAGGSKSVARGSNGGTAPQPTSNVDSASATIEAPSMPPPSEITLD